MQEILSELFYGNVRPNEKQFIRDSEYGKAIKTVSDREDRLMTLLSGKELELFSCSVFVSFKFVLLVMSERKGG